MADLVAVNGCKAQERRKNPKEEKTPVTGEWLQGALNWSSEGEIRKTGVNLFLVFSVRFHVGNQHAVFHFQG
ncbi:MAG TPA: hypothetical protein VIF12_07395, partial [Micavibrio sp.]